MKKSGFFSPALLSLMGVPAMLALASFPFALLQQQPKAAYADCFFFDEGADTITIIVPAILLGPTWQIMPQTMSEPMT
jgi:hypothetical protein